MTDLVEAPGSNAPARADVERVADHFVDLMRTFVKTRNRVLAAAARDVEWSAHVILKSVSMDGPMRASALAGHIQSDPSTVSRQVAGMVRDGLLERRADPGDGRAALLVVTERGRAVLATHNRLRLDYFAEMLADWTRADLVQFADLLERFTETYENADTESISERISRAGLRPEGTA